MGRLPVRRLEKLGLKLTETFPQATKVRIYSRATNTAALLQAWSNSPEDEAIGLDGERVVGTCEKKRRSVLVHDASKDGLLRGLQRHNFLSCLCAPICDDSNHIVGLLYLTSTEVEAFTLQDRFSVERIAQEVSPAFLPKDETTTLAQAPGAFDFLYSTSTLAAATLLFLMLGLFAIGPPDLKAEPESGQTGQRESTFGPREVTQKFAQHLRVGEYAQAWELLDPELQARWSRDEFQAQLKDWSKSESHQSILLARKLSNVKFEDDRAVATFYGSSQDGDTSDFWNWELRQVEGDWRVLSLQGGPVTSRGGA